MDGEERISAADHHRMPPAPAPVQAAATAPAHGTSLVIFGRPWQDLAFAAGEIVLLIGLFAMLLDSEANVPAVTGFVTAIMLYVLTIAHISYRNWLTVRGVGAGGDRVAAAGLRGAPVTRTPPSRRQPNRGRAHHHAQTLITCVYG